jgi:hypothetical protein
MSKAWSREVQEKLLREKGNKESVKKVQKKKSWDVNRRILNNNNNCESEERVDSLTKSLSTVQCR